VIINNINNSTYHNQSQQITKKSGIQQDSSSALQQKSEKKAVGFAMCGDVSTLVRDQREEPIWRDDHIRRGGEASIGAMSITTTFMSNPLGDTNCSGFHLAYVST
jgi:hypothetical protein